MESLTALTGQRPHLVFLDALRGLAALYVALGHAYVSMRPQLDLGRIGHGVDSLLKLTDLGHFAVAVFIVLSGYCLMLPVVRSADGRIPGGALSFFKRRSRRIMPPYYAALVLSVGIALLIEVLSDESRSAAAEAGALSLGSVGSHLLLVHNLIPQWSETINGPMWSVALEYQIYFLFPFVLLPVWRRFGVMSCLATAFAIGLAPLLLPAHENLHWTFPWYVGLFALGMTGAVISFSRQPVIARLRVRLPWGLLSAGLLVIVIGCLTQAARWCWSHLWLSDAFVGFAAMCVIVHLANQSQAGASVTGLVKVLSARPLVILGAFSYSLYLIHMPIMMLTAEMLRRTGIDPIGRLIVQMALVLPLAVMVAYWFYTQFEKPFVSSRKPNRAPVQPVTQVS